MSDTPDTPPGPLTSGSLFHEHYRIVRCLRAGGMGAVYEVVHLPTERRRALKTILPEWVSDPEMRARFRLEATVTAGVESEHIVEVLDAGVDDSSGLPFLVMELLKGESLGQLLERRGTLPREDVVRLLGQAALGLERAHAAGIVHRDLKPENLFVTQRDDGSDKLILLDFGIAKIVATSSQAATTRSLGTPLYMSPEHIRGDGDISPAADVYSLGQLAFTLLSGNPYFLPESKQQSSVYGLLLKILEGEREPASVRAARMGVSLPPRFDAWFEQATAAEPWQRFPGCAELVSALAEALELPAAGTHAGVARPLPPRPTRVARPVALWLGLGGCALLALGWWASRLRQPSVPEMSTPLAATASARAVAAATGNADPIPSSLPPPSSTTPPSVPAQNPGFTSSAPQRKAHPNAAPSVPTAPAAAPLARDLPPANNPPRL